MEKIKKIDWQNWNFQNCFPHVSWTPVPKKIKVYIFEKISSTTILQYLPFCSISFGYGENKKNWLTKLKFPKLFSSCFMNACSKKIKVYIFEKISFRTILQYLPFCSISFGYGENKKNWLTKLKFPKLFSSCFMNACSKKNKSLSSYFILFYAWSKKIVFLMFHERLYFIFEKISFWTILQYLPFCSLSFG